MKSIHEYQPLFTAVQMLPVFPDSKTFVDCIPLESMDNINARYMELASQPDFDLRVFVQQYFHLPHTYTGDYVTNKSATVEEHIEKLWDQLTREPEAGQNSLITLPHPYIVPGGRFGEVYYWDSYFTLLGLAISGRLEMLENMVRNFAYLIENVGFIPNGNRSYYLGRSQPPFFAYMVELLLQEKTDQSLIFFIPYLETEYNWWMQDSDKLSDELPAQSHCVRMPGGEVLNRYWDQFATARPEAFREDLQLAVELGGQEKALFRHLRAGAASGWDFSSRWFAKADEFASIETTFVIPVDLNCLLYKLEQLLNKAYEMKTDVVKADLYFHKFQQRKRAIQKYCWNEEVGFYFDYHFVRQQPCYSFSAAAVFPLFTGIAEESQALRVANLLAEKFLKPGGILTTLEWSGQQWDAPNGWAPLQWITIIGLENYGFHQLAKEIAIRWVNLNRDVFHRTGKMMEKYNVVDTQIDAGGGEYPGQDGFGWTNGVFLDLVKRYGV